MAEKRSANVGKGSGKWLKDHRELLVLAASLIVSAWALWYSCEANDVAEEANRLAREANGLAKEALKQDVMPFLHFEHRPHPEDTTSLGGLHCINLGKGPATRFSLYIGPLGDKNMMRYAFEDAAVGAGGPPDQLKQLEGILQLHANLWAKKPDFGPVGKVWDCYAEYTDSLGNKAWSRFQFQPEQRKLWPIGWQKGEDPFGLSKCMTVSPIPIE